MTPDEIIAKMTKGVSKLNVNLDKMMRESVIHCTETGKHLINRDMNGDCTECGYSESIDNFKK